MAGHSKWKQIKEKKGVTDKKRAVLFSKLLNAISIAAKEEPNPQFNPRLRSTIDKARENNVPNENIERAIKRASENENLSELLIEAYGPEGSALLIEAVSDSKNRTIAEIKKILSDNDSKIAEPGSVLWAFKKLTDKNSWEANFKQEISQNAKEQLLKLIEELEEYGDTQKIYTNA